MTDTNPRDLIQRMAEELDRYRYIATDDRRSTHPLSDEARAYLAQPEPEEPTDEKLLETAADAVGYEHVPTDETCLSLARALLARWGRSTPQPVSVSERLPGPEDCDAEGKCWWGRPAEELCNSDWFLATRAEVDEFCDAWPPIVFLPHWALPVPIKAS